MCVQNIAKTTSRDDTLQYDNRYMGYLGLAFRSRLYSGEQTFPHESELSLLDEPLSTNS